MHIPHGAPGTYVDCGDGDPVEQRLVMVEDPLAAEGLGRDHASVAAGRGTGAVSGRWLVPCTSPGLGRSSSARTVRTPPRIRGRGDERHRSEGSGGAILLTSAGLQRAVERDDSFLVVVSGLEAGTAPVTVGIILEPLKHLPHRPSGNALVSGIRGVQSLVRPLESHGAAFGHDCHDSDHSNDSDARPGFGAPFLTTDPWGRNQVP